MFTHESARIKTNDVSVVQKRKTMDEMNTGGERERKREKNFDPNDY